MQTVTMDNDFNNKNCVECNEKSLCFNKLSEEELLAIDRDKVVLKYKKGEIIAKQGAYVPQILFLQKGLVKVYKEVNDNENLVLTIFPSGSLIGLPSLYSVSKMEYTVSALVDSVICAMDKQLFEKFIKQNGEFAASVIGNMNNCLLYNFDKIISLTHKQMNGRLAEAILFLSDVIYKSDEFEMVLSRKDLAEFTGMSVMSVVRGIKDFKESMIISDENGTLKILNREKLMKISVTG
jgi:CRP/FNR family transcriptional regulator